MKNIVLAATGHRPKDIFTKDHYSSTNKRALVNFVKERIKEIQTTSNVTKIISGGALGWDQAIAWAAVELKIPFIMALPFPDMDSKWVEDSKKEFKMLLDRASEVVTLEKEYSNKAYYTRDKYMVDNCDLLIAFYNGSDSGGTAITIKYAESVNKKILNVWDQWNN